MIECPRYHTNMQAFPGTVAYSEATGFGVDLRQWANVDYATLHELAHMWWGDRITGAQMQGRQMLNETMAQYSTLVLYALQDILGEDVRGKDLAGDDVLHQLLRNFLDEYSFKTVPWQRARSPNLSSLIFLNAALFMIFIRENSCGYLAAKSSR